MAQARCNDCDHDWNTDKPAEAFDDRPHCPECESGSVDVRTSDGWFMVWR